MRPRLAAPRERLLSVLRRLGPCSAAALQAELDVPRTTVLRMLAEQQGAVVSAGAARRSRYAARRALRGASEGIPVYRIDAQGQAHAAGLLHLVQPDGSWWPLHDATWPVPEAARDGWWSGLPYPLQDMRLQGYMGRQFARHHHLELGLSSDPRDWSDDDQLTALTRAGHDAPGDLVLGDAALRRWQAQVQVQVQVQTQTQTQQQASPTSAGLIAENNCAATYAALAEAAVSTGVPGSSAAGEFPKFTARRALAGANTPEVIVKFSGADDSPAVRRWADLLQCEHLALQALQTSSAGELSVPVARSRLLQHGGRTFLESERFDRHGAHGRSPVVTLATLDAEALGQGHSPWPRLAQALAAMGWLDAADVRRISVIYTFGRLIGNTDMHTGNLAFVPTAGRLQLAPVYDMLPMRYAPLAGGEVPPLQAPPLAPPLPNDRDDWHAAATKAQHFWALVADSARISGPLRALAADQARQLAALV